MTDVPASGGRFALFADCLLTGVMTAVVSIPIITGYPALVAACAVMRERVAFERGVGPRVYLRHLIVVARSGPAVWIVPPVVVAVLVLDGVAVAAGAPGSSVLAVLLAFAVWAFLVLGLRAAARWRPGTPWRTVARMAVKEAGSDAGGSALIGLAGVAAVAIAVAVPVTALLVTGPLALAAVAVDGRRRAAYTENGA